MLINRVANTDMTWHQEVTTAAPRVSPIVDLTLDDSHVIRAIDNLNFIQMKRKWQPTARNATHRSHSLLYAVARGGHWICFLIFYYFCVHSLKHFFIIFYLIYYFSMFCVHFSLLLLLFFCSFVKLIFVSLIKLSVWIKIMRI